MKILIENWDSALIVLLFIIALIFMLRRGATKQVNEMLFYLVTEAEKQFGGGTGQLKYAAVVAWLYDRLPFIIRFIFTEKQIDEMIEEAVQRMKKYLESNIEARVLIVDSPIIRKEIKS